MDAPSTSPLVTITKVIDALGDTLKETQIIGSQAYAVVPDPLALRERMLVVEKELGIDIHCIVHVEQHHAMLSIAAR